MFGSKVVIYRSLWSLCTFHCSLLYLLTYLLTPWCWVLLEKLTGLQLVKKYPAFRGTRRFITALTSVRHLSPSWANPIQSIYPHPTSWRSIIILSTHLRLGLPSGPLHKHENYVSKKNVQRTVVLPTNSQRSVVSASYIRNHQSIYHDKYSAMNDSKVCWLRKESLYKVVSAYHY